jgi:lipid-A-disaccharide synthase
VLTAADVALCVSGTITLEGALCQTPLVVAYRMPWLTYQILRRLVRVDSIALPNLLMPGINVPERIQDAATAPKLAEALDAWLADPDRTAAYRARCAALHDVLHRGAGRAAAEAVLELIAAKRRMGQGKPG